jgi:hypothetical protein
MNTFYGVMGNKTSALFQLPLAGGVTSAGQYNLLLVKKYVESLDHKVYYGDSVTGDTPIIIRRNNIISIIPINELNWNDKKYEKYNNDKEIIIDNKTEVYTEKGWTIIKKCIRHYTNKKLYRISTQSGIVIVTEDHSLLNENSEKIKPEECKIGTNLLHWKNIDLECLETKYNINELINKPSIYCSNQLETQKIYLFLLKYNYRCNIETILNNNYKITIIKKIQNTIDTSITKIEFVGYSNDYVYDLETDSHHFSAGIGQLVVHNTDSLYISCPKEYYLETDKQYYTNQISKTEYNTQLVLITFKAIEDIKVKVNEYLYQNNGTRYLKMSYEEVLYPLAFLSKKKYFGIPHETLPNFKPKDLFIRGLEVKKRGVSELLRIICSDLMWKSMDLENTKSLRELVEDKIKEIFNTKWNLEDFIQTGVWKPDKQNQTLNKFVERMKEENKELPVPRERFSYVIVKKYPYKYDYKGRQIPLQKSDKMEYLDIVKKYNYEIDLKYYFDNQLTGQFARLITYDSEFEIIIDSNIDEDKTYSQCQKYVLKLADKYNNNYKDRNKIFKKVYKEINTKYSDIKERKNIYDKKYKVLLNTKYKIKDDEKNIFEILNYNIEEYIKNNNHEIETISNNIISKYNKDKQSLHKIYNNENKSYYTRQLKNLNKKYNDLIQEILNIITTHNLTEYLFNIDNINIINVVNHIRKKYNLDDICNSSEEINDIYDLIVEEDLNIDLENLNLYIKIDQEILDKLYNIYILILTVKKNIIIHNSIYNKYYANLNSNRNYIEKPHNFKL